MIWTWKKSVVLTKCREVLAETLALQGSWLADPITHFTRVNDAGSLVKVGEARPADSLALLMAAGGGMRTGSRLRHSP